jgi:hypothetical protein
MSFDKISEKTCILFHTGRSQVHRFQTFKSATAAAKFKSQCLTFGSDSQLHALLQRSLTHAHSFSYQHTYPLCRHNTHVHTHTCTSDTCTYTPSHQHARAHEHPTTSHKRWRMRTISGGRDPIGVSPPPIQARCHGS